MAESSWPARWLVAEALVLLLLARLLVKIAPLRLWRDSLGLPVGAPDDGEVPSPAARILASAVERADWRSPGKAKCLPRAMALHWMMRRRGEASTIAFAILPEARRGTLDDLHAWVESGACIVLGASEEPYRVIARFGGNR